MTAGRLRPEVKRKWLEALRSGEYKQGRSYLHYQQAGSGEERFCCLGVLCDLAVREGVIPPPVVRDGSQGKRTYVGHASTMPPDEVRNWAYQTMGDPDWRPWSLSGAPKTLDQLNDILALTFEQIADQIEIDL